MLPSVLYSHDIFSTQYVGGISRYVYELCAHNPRALIPTLYSENLYLNTHKHTKHFCGKTRLIYALNESYERILRAYKHFDIYHPSYYKALTKPKNTLLVTTIHDMIHEIYAGEFFPKNSKDSALKRHLCEVSDVLIAISHQTKCDLMHYFGIDERKIRVIHHGHSLQEGRKVLNLPKRYVLFVGAREGYKNFATFARAFATLAPRHAELTLLCVGKPFSPKERGFLESLGLAGCAQSLQARDDELYTLYNRALCFAFPSLYEGFGIPILESFYAHCPVALNDIAVFREVAGDCALYFDPRSIDSIAQCLESLIANQALAQALVLKAQSALQNFSWDKSASQTLNVYKSLIGGGASARVGYRLISALLAKIHNSRIRKSHTTESTQSKCVDSVIVSIRAKGVASYALSPRKHSLCHTIAEGVRYA